MRNIRAALESFWGGFLRRNVTPHAPLNAFPSGFAVVYGPGAPSSGKAPDLPYITYDIARPAFADFIILSGRIWTREISWGLVDDVLAQAGEKVPEGGLLMNVGDDGALWLMRSNPFIDYLPPENDDKLNKAGVIRLIVKSYIA